jgi:ppGpp synthetase/RelA/SpoT-type nucleotidyltranferase
VRRRREEQELEANGRPSAFNPADVEDAWGCRFVTLFQHEIVDVVEELFEFVVAQAGRERSLGIEDVVIYSNRPDKDPLSMSALITRAIEDVNFGERKPKTISIVNRESGYSSVHLIMRMPARVDFGGGDTEDTARFEIQVRDVFEDGWGEISHKLAYKRQTKGDAGPDVRRPDQAFRIARVRELNALKASADACSQHATLIDRNMAYWLDAAGLKGTERSVSEIEKDLANILALVPSAMTDARETLSVAYRTMQQAHDSAVRDIDNELSREFYRAAATKFKAAISKLAGHLDARIRVTNGMPVRYYLTLERANALVMSVPPFKSDEAAIGALRSAVPLYEGLRSAPDYAGDATIRLRLGQALARIANATQHDRDFEAAIAVLRDARRLAANDPLLQPLGSLHWLALEAYYQIAKAEFGRADAGKIARGDGLAHAITVGHDLVQVAQRFVEIDSAHVNLAHKCINNTLFAMTQLYRPDGAQIDDPARAKMKEYMGMLRRRPYRRFVETHTETIDTLMRAAVIVRQRDMALEMAYKNVAKLRQIARSRSGQDDPSSVPHYLDPDQREMYVDAMKLVHPL